MKPCKCKEPRIDSRVYLYLDTYKCPGGGGSALAQCKDCKQGVIVSVTPTYRYIPYSGDKTEDDWGLDLNKKK